MRPSRGPRLGPGPGHRGPFGGMGRHGHHVRPFLQRRIFFAFGFGIVLMGVLLLAAWAVSDRVNGSPWDRERVRVATFVASRFEKVWDDPAARTELATSMRRDLDLEVRGTDGSGQPLFATEGTCDKPVVVGSIVRSGTSLGSVSVCVNHRFAGGPTKFLVPFFIVAFATWFASGIAARRISRPLMEMAWVAEELGRGNLGVRVTLPRRHDRGEINVLAKVLNDMAARIERQLKDQRALLAAVSHEVRTPLARIRLLVELARSSEAPPEAQLKDIDGEVVEIDNLVSELLANSRMDFAAIVAGRLDARDIAQRALEASGVSGEVLDVDVVDPIFFGDATLVSRAVANVVDNAVKHSRGVVSLRVTEVSGRVRFTVDDSGDESGVGFAGDLAERIFEPFYKGAKSASGSPSSARPSVGLGLSLVRRIAEAHGGRAFAENWSEDSDGAATVPRTGGRVVVEFGRGSEALQRA